MPKITCPLSIAAMKFPNRPAILSVNESISYEQLNQLVNETANNLTNIGVRLGSRVAIIAPNSSQYLIALLSLWRLGAIACPISHRFPAATIFSMLKKINCRILLTDSRKPNLKSIAQYRLNEIVKGGKNKKPVSLIHKIDLNTPTTILFTSGSSGAPKAVLHSYGNHYYNAKGSNQNIKVSPGDCWFLSLPLYHVGGLGILFRCLMAGATVAIPENQSELAIALKTFNVTHLSLVSTQLYRLIKDKTNMKPLRHLKAVLISGSFIPQNLIDKALQLKLPLCKSYGLTELASQVTTISCRQSKLAKKCLLFRQIKISKDGEILVKGKTLFCGYISQSKVSLPLTKDGWFKTGDLGRFTKGGELVITGRKDNMFISGGENIYPEEIEKIIYEYPSIQKAIVLPVANDEFGARPVAFIKSQKPISRSKLVGFLERNLPRFKIPDIFYCWPKDTGREDLKINRASLSPLVLRKSATLKQLL